MAKVLVLGVLLLFAVSAVYPQSTENSTGTEEGTPDPPLAMRDLSASHPQGGVDPPGEDPPGMGEGTSDSPPTVQDLGDGRYLVGLIEVDTGLRHFSVTGKFEPGEQPAKSLAVTGAGFKIFESLFELDANAYEFNAACDLLGLVPGGGHLVDVRISWEIEGETTTVDAAEAVLLNGDTLPGDGWLYTGSTYTPEGELLAHLDGTLISIFQDPLSIIEHASGLVAEDSGSSGLNTASLPPAETSLVVTVERR